MQPAPRLIIQDGVHPGLPEHVLRQAFFSSASVQGKRFGVRSVLPANRAHP